MVGLVDSFKKFAIVLAILILLGITSVALFDFFFAPSLSAIAFSQETIRTLIIVGFWAVIVFLIRRAKPFMTVRLGAQPTTILQFFMIAVAVLVMSLGVLHAIGVSPPDLIEGAGIASLTVGLIVSTFVGGILSGALVFTTQGFRVGDDVLINNTLPGRIIDMTILVTKIRTEVGQIAIPNSAIASGGVIMTAVHKRETQLLSRLPYEVGDRAISTYINEEGTVKEITPLHTIIRLDSGRELTFLNNSVLTGSVAVAKITREKETSAQTKEKTKLDREQK